MARVLYIADATYYMIDGPQGPIACGGWSRRQTLYGGDQHKPGNDPLLDPEQSLAATLPGVPLYTALGFAAHERDDVPLPNGVRLPIVRMTRLI